MSLAAKRRKRIRWARYFNHYSHIPAVWCGGKAAFRAIVTSGPEWRNVRRQARR